MLSGSTKNNNVEFTIQKIIEHCFLIVYLSWIYFVASLLAYNVIVKVPTKRVGEQQPVYVNIL